VNQDVAIPESGNQHPQIMIAGAPINHQFFDKVQSSVQPQQILSSPVSNDPQMENE